jgi:putative ABC transport system substrate-binding protein
MPDCPQFGTVWCVSRKLDAAPSGRFSTALLAGDIFGPSHVDGVELFLPRLDQRILSKHGRVDGTGKYGVQASAVRLTLQRRRAVPFREIRQRLFELGYVEGTSIAFELLSAEGNYDLLPSLAADLVRRDVELIFANATPAVIAAKNATRTIPIVFAGAGDPVASGIVASLRRPAGNVTGISILAPETAAKTLELLSELIPAASRIAVLSNPQLNRLGVIKEMQATAAKLRLELVVVEAGGPETFQQAVAEIARHRPAGLAIPTEVTFVNHYEGLAALAIANRLPAISGNNLFPERGGLISYGSDRIDGYRRAAELIDKILKGAKPADLPVEQPTKFELVLNLRTAKGSDSQCHQRSWYGRRV